MNTCFGDKGAMKEVWRGPLGPEGEQIYRVMLRRKPRPSYIEVLEEQLELVPAKT